LDRRSIKSRLEEYLRAIGVDISPGGMIHCPFHEDDTPSMKLYSANAQCFVCNKGYDIYDFAAWRLGLPCNREHFPEIAREVERALGIPCEWKPSAEERRAYWRKNRDMAGKSMGPLSQSAVYRNALLREMAEAVDGGNMERALDMAELIFALYLLPDAPAEKKLSSDVKERRRMAEGLAGK
jgi:DNA primase